MHGFVIHCGGHWDASSAAFALQRLRHYAAPHSLIDEAGLSLTGLGQEYFHSKAEEKELWSYGLGSDEQASAAAALREDAFERDATSRWPEGIFLVRNHPKRTLLLMRGEFSPYTIKYSIAGGSLFSAPEVKAFSKLSSARDVEGLLQGHTLEYAMDSSVADETDRTRDRDFPDPRTFDYAETQKTLRTLLESAIHAILKRAPRPLALALGGGLDGAIAAWLAVQAGERPQAYTVWFDGGRGRPPADLSGARIIAQNLKLDLAEIRVGPKEIAALVEETICRAETDHPVPVEAGLYLTRLCAHFSHIGVHSVLTGDGVDGLLGGIPQLGAYSNEKVFRHKVLAVMRRTIHIESEHLIRNSFDVTSFSPFLDRSVIDFARNLPLEFLIDRERGHYVGKRLARDAFADILPKDIVRAQKVSLAHSAGATRLVEKRYGPLKRRNEKYEVLYDMLLRPGGTRSMDRLRLTVMNALRI